MRKDVVFVNTGSAYVSFSFTQFGSHEGTRVDLRSLDSVSDR